MKMILMWCITMTCLLFVVLLCSYFVCIPRSAVVGYHFEVNGVQYGVVCTGCRQTIPAEFERGKK